MKTLVISDTHGNAKRAFAVYDRSEPVDLIIHLGDGAADADLMSNALNIPVIGLAGNCDHGSKRQRELIVEYEGQRIMLTHGDAYQVKYGLEKLLQRAKEVGVDAALFGHTHLAVAEKHEGLQLINPGALANHCHRRSYAVLDITPGGINCRHFTAD